MKILAQAIQEWMEKYKRNSVKPTTYDRLETSFETLKNYRIAHMGILEITSEDLQDFINTMVEDGYALTTIKKQYHLVTGYLKYANTEGIIPKAIFNNVKLPKQTAVKKKKREVLTYSKKEQVLLRRIFQTSERTGYGAALLMMETGLRVGECLALTWGDIQWERRAVSVNKTLIRLTNRRKMEVQDGAKSYTSNRVVPLNGDALRLLEELYGRTKNENGYIFADEDGNMPISYEALRYQIQCACSEANVPYLGQHVFRHTFATNCYYRGCNVKILSKLLGHSDVSITYNVYIHLFGDALEEMRSVVG